MNFVSYPVKTLQGEISIPGDKSISHRSIIFGSIAQGITHVHGFLDGEDCLSTMRIFQSMGVVIERPSAQELVIHGVGKYGLKMPATTLNCGNSGTTMRLLTGLLAAQAFDTELTGDASLLKRPMERVRRPLELMGAQVQTHEGRPPVRILGGERLRGISYDMPEASAQVKSCLLLAGLYATGETTIVEPGITRDHTERMLKSFSYPVKTSDNTVIINSASECFGTDIWVPGDISSAAFFMVAATLIPNAELLIKNVGINPTRTGIIHILREMGADITFSNERSYGDELVADICVKHAILKGIQIPISMVPLAIDEFPVLFIAASCATGTTILRGAKELRCKESDRIGAMVDGLQAVGIDAEALDDGVIIQGGRIQGGQVDSRGDHRIAMAFAVAGSIATAPITIKDCANVATSFPSFVNTAQSIRLNIQEITDDL